MQKVSVFHFFFTFLTRFYWPSKKIVYLLIHRLDVEQCGVIVCIFLRIAFARFRSKFLFARVPLTFVLRSNPFRTYALTVVAYCTMALKLLAPSSPAFLPFRGDVRRILICWLLWGRGSLWY